MIIRLTIRAQPTVGNPDALLFAFGGCGTAVGERR
jgi:hypothetical protein